MSESKVPLTIDEIFARAQEKGMEIESAAKLRKSLLDCVSRTKRKSGETSDIAHDEKHEKFWLTDTQEGQKESDSQKEEQLLSDKKKRKKKGSEKEAAASIASESSENESEEKEKEKEEKPQKKQQRARQLEFARLVLAKADGVPLTADEIMQRGKEMGLTFTDRTKLIKSFKDSIRSQGEKSDLVMDQTAQKFSLKKSAEPPKKKKKVEKKEKPKSKKEKGTTDSEGSGSSEDECQHHATVDWKDFEKIIGVCAITQECSDDESSKSKGKKKKREREVLQFLVKWKSTEHEKCSWQDESAVIAKVGQKRIDEYKTRIQTAFPNADPYFEYVKCESQPQCLTGGALDGPQIEQLNNLLKSFSVSKNVVTLTDSSQSDTSKRVVPIISFISSLVHRVGSGGPGGPFLIVTSPSKMREWLNMFERWDPSINVVAYQGSRKSRDLCWKYEIFSPLTPPSSSTSEPQCLMAQVVLTTFENVLSDADRLFQLRYHSLVLDNSTEELSSKKEIFSQQVKTGHRILLLSREPQMDSVEHVFNFLTFLSPEKAVGQFSDFETSFASLSKEEQTEKMKQLFSPYLL